MVHAHGEQANDEAETLIKDAHVGAIIYYRWSNGLHSQEQVAALSSGLQTLADQTRLQLRSSSPSTKKGAASPGG